MIPHVKKHKFGLFNVVSIHLQSKVMVHLLHEGLHGLVVLIVIGVSLSHQDPGGKCHGKFITLNIRSGSTPGQKKGGKFEYSKSKMWVHSRPKIYHSNTSKNMK